MVWLLGPVEVFVIKYFGGEGALSLDSGVVDGFKGAGDRGLPHRFITRCIPPALMHRDRCLLTHKSEGCGDFWVALNPRP